ncbi:hypothetical protein FSARC_7385 [Fusarium sarcochroum]|uniref:Uncharacterized protein n=1 Tax=Fusarium sarcochroum TaxID=1208366 RepID=A0A8H4TVH5_9HYPO|nr:hypothetical protein FSARC_7385 [Fusarium sarcochroum]
MLTDRLLHLEEDTSILSLGEFAQRGAISLRVFNGYLELLRTSAIRGTITEPIPESGYRDFLGGLNRKKTWVIPVQCESSWSFFVARPDGVHWYQDGLIPKDQDTFQVSQCGESHKEKTAACVLLGIRLLSQGLPQIDSETIARDLSNWCTRLLIELLCQRLDPDVASVDQVYNQIGNVLSREQELEPSYFDDACGNLFPDASARTSSPAINDEDDGEERPATTARAPNRLRVSSSAEPPLSDGLSQEAVDIKNIMEVLSDATIATRCMGPYSKKDLAALCNIVSEKKIESYFHVRYCRQQIYSRLLSDTADVGDINPDRLVEIKHWTEEVRSKYVPASFILDIKAECRAWSGIRRWCRNEGFSEFTVLCAIPKTKEWSCRSLDRLCERLSDSSDTMRYLLKKTEKLCDAIVRSNLPSHTLCIELYPGKRQESFSHNAFAAFVSVDHNPVIGLDRAVSLRGRKRQRISSGNKQS